MTLYLSTYRKEYNIHIFTTFTHVFCCSSFKTVMIGASTMSKTDDFSIIEEIN
jgi:hypothetical protein